MTDQEIINLIDSRKEDKALNSIYKEYSTIEKSLISIGASKDEAMDIFQEALYLFVEKVRAGGFVLSSKITTYLFSVCRYIYLNERKKQNKEIKAVDELQYLDNEFDWESEIQNRKAEQAFKSIGDKCQEILIAYYQNQLSMAKIAEVFGFGSEKSAKSQKYKCLEKAKANFNELQMVSEH